MFETKKTLIVVYKDELLMNQLKKQGVGVLFVSSELPEVMGISDRIIVMCDGRITGELSPDEATEDRILQYATQFEAKV